MRPLGSLLGGEWLAGATAFLCGWFTCRALAPAALGRALDALVTAEPRQLAWWTGALLGLGILQAGSGIIGHRFAVVTWLGPAYRTVQVVTRQVTPGSAPPCRSGSPPARWSRSAPPTSTTWAAGSR